MLKSILYKCNYLSQRIQGIKSISDKHRPEAPINIATICKNLGKIMLEVAIT